MVFVLMYLLPNVNHEIGSAAVHWCRTSCSKHYTHVRRAHGLWDSSVKRQLVSFHWQGFTTNRKRVDKVTQRQHMIGKQLLLQVCYVAHRMVWAASEIQPEDKKPGPQLNTNGRLRREFELPSFLSVVNPSNSGANGD